MKETRFAVRNAQPEFHWAWCLVPLGSIAVALLIASLVFKPVQAPAPTLAANATLIAAETAAGAEITKRPPTLK